MPVNKHFKLAALFRLRPLQVVVLAVLFLSILYPFLELLKNSFVVTDGWGLDNYKRFFDPQQSRALDALWGSVWVSLLSVLFAGLLGVPLALLFERVDLPAKRLLAALATLPIVLPPLVGVVAFLFLLGESGILPRLLQKMLGLEKPIFYLAGVRAVIVVHAYSFYVYFFLFTRAALRRLDGSSIEAARSLGAGKVRVYAQIIWPQMQHGIRAAAILVFMISMASFSAPFIFGGKYRFLTVEIYNSKLQGQMPMAITQSVLLGAISIAFLYFMLRREKALQSLGQKGVPLPARALRGTGTRIIAGMIAAIASVVLVLPHLTLVLISFVKNGTWTSQLLPDTFTLENYANLLRDPDVAAPILNSAKMAILATTANVALALAIAYWNTRRSWRFSRLSESLVMLPWAIPGTVIAIALIICFNQPHWFTAGSILVGTFWILPLAYFIRHLPIVYRAGHAALLRFEWSQEEAALSLGAGRRLIWWKVILPAIRPAVIAGALLAGVMALGEFVSSIVLYSFSNRPISVAILSEIRLFNLGSAAAYGVFLTVLIFIISWFSARWGEM